ncbi:MAG: hypothetical protein QOF01_4909 [Thermomicrobiales bacterium]|jgi:hypothetical protein|nr:hypothetical protein [Thermomicrobiales bacterium]
MGLTERIGDPRREERTLMASNIQTQEGWTRRQAMAAGAGTAVLAAGLGALLPANRAGAQLVRTGGGIAGGGQVKEEGSRTHFSVFASRFEGESLKEPVFVGRFQWVDGKADITIESTKIDFYGPIEGGSENDRELRGTAKLNDEDGHPFLVRMADEGGPGSGTDSISVFLGKAGAEDAETDPIYKLEGKLDVGDLQLLQIELPF